MQKDIIKKIDLLVEMSDTNNSFDTLKEELNVLESEIASQKSEIARLKKAIERNKYLNSSDRIIDENIKIGLENKLDGYEKALSEILLEIEKVSQEEEEYHQMIVELEQEIETSKRFLESLELKLKTIGSKDKSVYTFYEELIDTTTKEIKANETRLHVKQKAYEQVQSRLQSYGDARFDLEEKMKRDTDKLEETKAYLEMPDTYIDQTAKRKDEETLASLEEELEKLEKRRLEILTDPAYIGHDAIDLLINDDRTSALAKVKELVTIVNAKPYMDFRYEELDEILEDAKQRRDEFSNVIDGKKYDGTDNNILEERMNFLTLQIEAKTKEEEELKAKIREMDVDLVQELMKLITEAKQKRDQLKVDIDEYKTVMEENNDYKSPKKKASLNAAFHRKCEELEQVNDVILSYEKDLEKTVESSKELEETTLSLILDELKVMQEEINSYKKKKMFQNSPTDILAVEKDKSELKKLSDEVNKIEHRKKYHKTPNDLFDEIEISLSSDDLEEEPVKEETPVDLKDYRINFEEEAEEPVLDDKKEEELQLPVEEESLEEQPQEEMIEPVSVDEILPYTEEEKEEEEKVFPPRNENAHLYEVIAVEPIEESTESSLPQEEKAEESLDEKVEPVPVDEILPYTEEEKEEEKPVDTTNSEENYMVNDFDDTDYISFNDLLEGSMNDGN